MQRQMAMKSSVSHVLNMEGKAQAAIAVAERISKMISQRLPEKGSSSAPAPVPTMVCFMLFAIEGHFHFFFF